MMRQQAFGSHLTTLFSHLIVQQHRNEMKYLHEEFFIIQLPHSGEDLSVSQQSALQ